MWDSPKEFPCLPPYHPILCVRPIYSPMWDSGTFLRNPMSTPYHTILCVCPILQSHVNRWNRPKESHVYHHTTQSYVSVLSYSPMWDRWDCPKEVPCLPPYHPILCVRPILQSHVDSGTVLRNPCLPPYHPILCVRPILQSHVDRWDCPKESHVYHHTTLSYVSVLSYSPIWDRWDRPKESHVYHHTTQSYVSVPSYQSHLGQVGLS